MLLPFKATFAVPLTCDSCINEISTALSTVPGQYINFPLPFLYNVAYYFVEQVFIRPSFLSPHSSSLPPVRRRLRPLSATFNPQVAPPSYGAPGLQTVRPLAQYPPFPSVLSIAIELMYHGRMD